MELGPQLVRPVPQVVRPVPQVGPVTQVVRREPQVLRRESRVAIRLHGVRWVPPRSSMEVPWEFHGHAMGIQRQFREQEQIGRTCMQMSGPCIDA